MRVKKRGDISLEVISVLLNILCIHISLISGEGNDSAATAVTGAVVTAPVGPTTPLSPSVLNGICSKEVGCVNPTSTRCVNSGENNDLMRCRCAPNYYHYKTPDGYLCGEVQPATVPASKICNDNFGILVKTAAGDLKCSCPTSRNGANCEEKAINVTCSTTSMNICLNPTKMNITWDHDWAMYAQGKLDKPSCVGSNATELDASSANCSAGNQFLALNLTTSSLEMCGTLNTSDSSNKKYQNQISISNANVSIEGYSLIVYCSFRQYVAGKFDGIGMVSSNGNENGQQIDASIILSMEDRLGKTITAGSIIMVGDQIKFTVTLSASEMYGSVAVRRCTASSSPFMPDSTAQTRALVVDECPVQDEATRDSWYWTADSATSSIIRSGLVKMFQMSTSNVVYIHCTFKVCLKNDATGCKLMTPEACKAKLGRKKRSASHVIVKRAATQTASTYTTITVNEPTSQSSQIMYAVVFSVLIAAVAIVLVFGTAMYLKKRNNKNPGEEKPEVFALPRITPTHNRI